MGLSINEITCSASEHYIPAKKKKKSQNQAPAAQTPVQQSCYLQNIKCTDLVLQVLILLLIFNPWNGSVNAVFSAV